MENKGFVTLTENQMYQVNGGSGVEEVAKLSIFSIFYFATAATNVGMTSSNKTGSTYDENDIGKFCAKTAAGITDSLGVTNGATAKIMNVSKPLVYNSCIPNYKDPVLEKYNSLKTKVNQLRDSYK